MAFLDPKGEIELEPRQNAAWLIDVAPGLVPESALTARGCCGALSLTSPGDYVIIAYRFNGMLSARSVGGATDALRWPVMPPCRARSPPREGRFARLS